MALVFTAGGGYYYFKNPPPLHFSNPEYYAYGDSMTRAAGSGDLNPDGSDCYIFQMVNTFKKGSVADHNMDGASKTSSWGLENFESHFPKGVRYFIIFFGANDRDIEPSVTASNLIEMKEKVERRNATAIIVLSPLVNPNEKLPNTTVINQTARLLAIQQILDGKNISYVKMYDALDSIPKNNRIDSLNLSHFTSDGIHPGKQGQKRMAEYLWENAF